MAVFKSIIDNKELAMGNIGWLFGTFAIAYLLGSIPFGLLITRFFEVGDIRKVGSGNIGATNVMRTGRKGLAVATLLADLGKGAVAVIVANYLYEGTAPIAGLFAVLGHVFPLWLKFHGGKGVATTIGVFFALNWVLGLIVCLIWLGMFLITRFSSLSAIVSVAYSPIFAYILDGYLSATLCFSLILIIIFTHRYNIERLMSGIEPAFSGNFLSYKK